MKKMNTKELIIKTLSELMIKTPYDEITVSDIIENTGIARSTFYRHFKDKQDVLECIFEEIVVKGNIFDYSRSIKERETDLLHVMMKHPLLWKYLHENPSFNTIWRDYAAKSTYMYLKREYPHCEVQNLEFFCTVLGAGFIMLNLDVLTGNLDMEPEKMGEEFQSIIDTFIKNTENSAHDD